MERVAFVIQVKEGQLEEYIRRHKQIWPEVIADMQKAGVYRTSIFHYKGLLFVYMEVKDYAETSRLLAASPDSARWEAYMAPILENAAGDEYDPRNAYSPGLPEVFHWQAG